MDKGVQLEEPSFLNEAKCAYQYSMDQMLFSQAVFYAESMLVHSSGNPEWGELLGKALLFNGEPERAFEVLFGFVDISSDTDSRGQLLSESGLYLLAKVCFGLQKFNEALLILCPKYKDGADPSRLSSKLLQSVVNGAPGLFLLGRVFEQLGNREFACECYRKCLDVCPVIFEAFERLSELSIGTSKVSVPGSRFSEMYLSGRKISDWSSSNGGIVTLSAASTPVIAPLIMTGSPTKRGKASTGASKAEAGVSTPKAVAVRPRITASPPTISKPDQRMSDKFSIKTGVPHSQQFSLTDYLHVIGSAVHSINSYDCGSAVGCLTGRLSAVHVQSVRVQCLLGKAYMEMGKYVESAEAFGNALKLSPVGVISHVDKYSSVLWQLKQELELAHLCSHALRVGNRAKHYKIWAAIGNAFSLKKEHDSAIKFLNRSLQINPSYVYGHVLIGHEFFALDKTDKARECYMQAIELDPNCYNAYWGLGQIFYKQEEYATAKFNFIKALDINPKSSIIRYSLALSANALRENDLAYQQLCIAVELNPLNAPALCQKGLIELSTAGKQELAKSTFEKALAVAPNEPVIHFILGRIHAASAGNRQTAMSFFNKAFELTSGGKDAFGIKQCVEEIDALAGASVGSG